MFAVIKTGGKQYKVAKNDVLTVERLAGEAGSTVSLDQVLMVGEAGEAPKVGAPTLAGANVAAEVVEHTRGRKIRVFKKKRRKHYRRTQGHRQDLTVLRVTDIRLDGADAATADAATADAEAAATAKTSKTASRSAQKKASQDAATLRSKAKATTTRKRAAGLSSPSTSKSSKTTAAKSTGAKGASGGTKAKKSE